MRKNRSAVNEEIPTLTLKEWAEMRKYDIEKREYEEEDE